MRKIFKRIKKKPILIFTVIFFTLFLLSSICLIYSILRISNIENLLRYLICALLVILIIYYFLSMIKIIFKGKNAGIIFYDIIFILLFVLMSFITVSINNIYNSISKMYKNDYSYSVSLVSLSNSNIKQKNIKNYKIGIINKDSNSELNEVSNLIIDENELKNINTITEYDNTSDMVKALYNKDIDLVLLPSEYVSIFSSIDDYKDISEETNEIINKSVKRKRNNTTDNKKSEQDPITILLLGMDSTVKDISKVTSFNADSLMLITFNPKTYRSTILSIPRDTYVPISCNGNLESKITHSGWNGESCVISTIENWMGINIDYYLKINFTALVSIVDKIGGIEVNVPYSFCEQNSNREWGSNTVYVEKGLQKLNGEQALALSRNRHPNPRCGEKWSNYYSNDLVRGENQQAIVNALTNKIVKSLNIENIYSLLDIIGTNVDTNMKINEMTAYYNVLKKLGSDENHSINFERLQISTYGKSLYDPLLRMSGMSMQIYYKDSLNAVINEMKVNLGLEKPNAVKSFKFSAVTPYKATTIGSGTYNQIDIETVPSFIGKDVSVAESWAQIRNISTTIDYKESEQENNIVISQSISPSYRVDKIDKSIPLKLTVSRKISE